MAGLVAMRRPESCEHRRYVPSPGTEYQVCDFARRATGQELAAAPRVNRSICEACCRHPLPAGGSLNPVIASLVIAAADEAGERSTLEASEHVFLRQAKQFAARWLNSSGNLESSRARAIRSESSNLQSSHTADSNGAPSAHAAAASRMKIGLVGQYSPSGLGNMHEDIARHLGIERWLIPFCAGGRGLPHGLPCRIDTLPHPNDAQLWDWLHGLDAVVFVERPACLSLTALARQQGVAVVCVPMWEYLHPGQEWLDEVDLMLAPAQFTFEMLSQWIARFGFPWKLAMVPWPVDIHRFRYRPRDECRRFVFVNGRGGRSALAWGGSAVQFQRKGLAVLLAAARLVPEIPIIVYSCERPEIIPLNVELRPPPGDNSLLYCDGDVCVQPSHWEGLGLPLLECQSSGMPLITTGAPPMSEHRPLALIPATVEPMLLRPQQCIFGARIEPPDLASTLRSVHGRNIRSASRQARRFIEREHSWPIARPRILEAIANAIATVRKR